PSPSPSNGAVEVTSKQIATKEQRPKNKSTTAGATSRLYYYGVLISELSHILHTGFFSSQSIVFLLILGAIWVGMQILYSSKRFAHRASSIELGL
ncbi:hypothetical protein ACJX0J_021569, partial [Zea mays]